MPFAIIEREYMFKYSKLVEQLDQNGKYPNENV